MVEELSSLVYHSYGFDPMTCYIKLTKLMLDCLLAKHTTRDHISKEYKQSHVDLTLILLLQLVCDKSLSVFSSLSVIPRFHWLTLPIRLLEERLWVGHMTLNSPSSSPFDEQTRSPAPTRRIFVQHILTINA